MFSILLSLFSNASGLSKFLPYILGVVAVLVMYVYAHNAGYNKAEAVCNAAMYQAQVVAEKAEIDNLTKQLNDTQAALSASQKQKQVVITKTIIAKKAVEDNVQDNPICNVSPNVVELLNAARSTSSNHK